MLHMHMHMYMCMHMWNTEHGCGAPKCKAFVHCWYM